ncbi:MAG: hypothetical protein CMJ83_21255 [Planctomycetes bacterium]|nr:hypothetical protein [Planctomycetota bacterium]
MAEMALEPSQTVKSTCTEARALVGPYRDHTLEPALEARFASHLDGCAPCRAFHDGYVTANPARSHKPLIALVVSVLAMGIAIWLFVERGGPDPAEGATRQARLRGPIHWPPLPHTVREIDRIYGAYRRNELPALAMALGEDDAGYDRIVAQVQPDALASFALEDRSRDERRDIVLQLCLIHDSRLRESIRGNALHRLGELVGDAVLPIARAFVLRFTDDRALTIACLAIAVHIDPVVDEVLIGSIFRHLSLNRANSAARSFTRIARRWENGHLWAIRVMEGELGEFAPRVRGDAADTAYVHPRAWPTCGSPELLKAVARDPDAATQSRLWAAKALWTHTKTREWVDIISDLADGDSDDAHLAVALRDEIEGN